MGCGNNYRPEEYEAAYKARDYGSKSREDLFEKTARHDTQASSFNIHARKHNTDVRPEMLSVGVRESRNSPNHPHVDSFFFGLDNTGSMTWIPEDIIKHQFPKLMNGLKEIGIKDPQLLFMAVGDHFSDTYPCQVSQFECETEKILDTVQHLYLEGNGGGNGGSIFNIKLMFYIKSLCIVYPNIILNMTERVLEKLRNNKIKELYESGKSLRELEKLIHTDKRDIKLYLISVGAKLRNGTKYPDNYEALTIEDLEKSKSERTFNSKVFDNIDTEEKAYWLGFWFADGCVNSDMLHLELSLKADDVVHLHKFNRFVESEYNNVKYHYKKDGTKVFDLYRWTNQSKHMCETLNSYGCTPRKSLTLKFPDESIFKSKDLIKHFIRGYWDGDGCICFTETTKIASAVGTLELLTAVKSYLPIDAGIITKKQESENTYTLQFSGKQAFKILHYLYNNSKIYLNRKFEKYKDFCRMYEESCILLETKIGESCDANTEVNSEIKESESP